MRRVKLVVNRSPLLHTRVHFLVKELDVSEIVLCI